jgi:hypothetical protein
VSELRVSRRGVLAVLLVAFATSGRRAFAVDSPVLQFDELYASFGALGLTFSERARQLAGTRVVIRGFMAPPLKPEASFVVLARRPVAVCPFCQSDADWPEDIVVVFLAARTNALSAAERVEAEGVLELGGKVDPATGFVSQVRLVGARVRQR